MAALVVGRSLDQKKKRAIVLHEIEYWRQSRLLPEPYCDFLSNLYREDGNRHRVRTVTTSGWLHILNMVWSLLSSWFCHYFLHLFDWFLFYRFSVGNANILDMRSHCNLLWIGWSFDVLLKREILFWTRKKWITWVTT